MATVKPTIPKGTRDFLPEEMIRRNYIFSVLRNIFEKHGYLPIETPAIENLSTLMGKYGEEGDRLLFKILNSGDYRAGVDFSEPNANVLATKLCEKGLRYDLTVPFARFVVQHQNDITVPFKRYQMQPVWRADRPQKGRYREFYQCDIDIIGSTSLLNEAELIGMTDEIFAQFKINVIIKLNNRKILSGLAEISGAADKVTDICTAIDKLDKIGKEKVCEELLERGIPADALAKLSPCFGMSGTNEEKLEKLSEMFANSEIGKKGIEEVRTTLDYLSNFKINSEVELDITLARGLNYYTGAIFEVKAKDVEIGSISGGGRYDNLTGIFGLKNMSGVGISYGAERIYDVLDELNLFPDNINNPVKALFLNFGEDTIAFSLKNLQTLRKAGVPCELYPDSVKIGKQMTYANNKKIPYVIMAGSDEIKENVLTLKDMTTSEQKKMSIALTITQY